MSEEQDMQHWPDDQLLRAAHGGDENAFVIFCVRSLRSLHRYLSFQCARMGVPRDLASDFAHDTFIRAVAQIRACSEDAHRPLPKVSIAWLFQIGYNLIVDWKRANSRARVAVAEAIRQAKSKRPSAEEIERHEEVLKFFNWLTPGERDIIELVLVEGLHVLDAGKRLGLSEAASYKAYERALRKLSDLVREHGSLADRSVDNRADR